MARERLSTQLAIFDGLDTKVGTTFAASSAILALLAAVFAIRAEELGRASLVVISIAGLAYVVVTLCLAASHWPQGYAFGPKLDDIWEDAQRKDDSTLVPELILDYIHSIRFNDRQGRFKPRILRIALLGTFIETLALAVGLAVVAAA